MEVRVLGRVRVGIGVLRMRRFDRVLWHGGIGVGFERKRVVRKGVNIRKGVNKISVRVRVRVRVWIWVWPWRRRESRESSHERESEREMSRREL